MKQNVKQFVGVALAEMVEAKVSINIPRTRQVNVLIIPMVWVSTTNGWTIRKN